MKISRLFVTQNRLRDYDCIPRMMNFVSNGGIWTHEEITKYSAKSFLVQITEFPDEFLIIHDGHHRLFATVKTGRLELHESEYVISRKTYEQYLEINPANKWVTPFDPRTQCRLPDLSTFKNKLKGLSDKELVLFIKNNSSLYLEPRRYNTILDLAIDLGVERV